MTFVFTGVALVLVFNTALLAFLAWAHQSPRFAKYRISTAPGMKVPMKKRLGTMALISTCSLLWVVGGTYLGFDALVRTSSSGALRTAFEALAILVLYDFLYYGMHRTLHHKKLMRFVHGVHHRARNPSAFESFFLHPIELSLGLGLLFACTWVVGPVSPVAFLIAFFVYSNLNIIIHSGLDLPGALLAPTSLLTRKHHIHHQKDFSKNYASLSPIPDWVFGTLG
ncbi:MAG: sterol desaturase family protein [Myxococcota bacterium]